MKVGWLDAYLDAHVAAQMDVKTVVWKADRLAVWKDIIEAEM